MSETREVTITVRIAKIGNAYMAVTSLAGISVRGKRADTPDDALRALLYTMADRNNDDAATAIDLAASGETLEALYPTPAAEALDRVTHTGD